MVLYHRQQAQEAPNSGLLHSRFLCFIAGILLTIVATFLVIYYLTGGQGVEIIWPGGNPDEKYDVEINLLEGERYFFTVNETGMVQRRLGTLCF